MPDTPITDAQAADAVPNAAAPEATAAAAEAPASAGTSDAGAEASAAGAEASAAGGDAPAAFQASAAANTPKAKSGKARPAFAVLERLFQLYPKMFGARFLPLKLGVYQELLALHPDEFKKEDLKVALGVHARSTRYLESVAAGHKRHDLNGNPVEDVAPEHVHHAIMEVFRRRQARSKEDQRPWLRARLVQSIEASGLSREEYTERVNAKDELSLAMLDEAFAVVAEQAAKREALRRAFEASGKSVAEFAEMYGMEPAVVRKALGPRVPNAPSQPKAWSKALSPHP